MAVYKIFPEKDATLYSLFPSMNTGLDPIIEATLTTFAYSVPNPQVSRFLIQFNTDEIDYVIENKISSSTTWSVNLNCFVATATGLEISPTGTLIECFPVSGSWGMGTGLYLDDPITTDGTSWIWQDYSGSIPWKTSNWGSNVTASFNTNYAVAGGGTWYTGSPNPTFTSSVVQSQSFGYKTDKDINLNVTNTIKAWYSGAFANNGFLLKQNPEFVNNINYQPELKFYSVDTNTIYPPQLQFNWRDYTFITGASNPQTILNSLPATVTIAQNPGVFYSESVNRFRINARPEYPTQLWQTSSVYTNNYYLPTASYYAIKDTFTNEYVVGFSDLYTQLSADNSSSYFDVYMNGLEPERYYTILIKSNINGSTIVFDDQYSFKVING